MPNSMTLIGNADMPAAGPGTPEAAAAEFFTNRQIMGNFTPRPNVARWRADQREAFEAELDRLEKQNARQSAEAVQQAGGRAS